MDVTITHPFVGNSASPASWGTYQPGVLAARANAKQHKHWYHALYSISFMPFVTTTHGLLNGEALRLLFLLAEALANKVFLDRGWEHPSPEVLKQHCARHFQRFRGLVLLTAFKAAATRMQSGLPWARAAAPWDQVPPPDPELDVPLLPRGYDCGFLG